MVRRTDDGSTQVVAMRLAWYGEAVSWGVYTRPEDLGAGSEYHRVGQEVLSGLSLDGAFVYP